MENLHALQKYFNENYGYIYLRNHESYDMYNAYKLGRTKNIPERNSTYTTGEFVRGYFVLVLELKNYSDDYVEKLLHRHFVHLRLQREFFHRDILNDIIPYLTSQNIICPVLDEIAISKLTRSYRISKIQSILDIVFDKLKRIFINIFFKKWIKQILKTKSIEALKRDELQDKYITKIIPKLEQDNKCFIKAPTGFGKTHIFYKIIKYYQFNKILFLTPRISLNHQIVKDEYSIHLNMNDYTITHFSDYSNSEQKKSELLLGISSEKFIITSCYQSGHLLLELCNELHLVFDLIIFDEAHFMTNWGILPHTCSIKCNSIECNSVNCNILLNSNIARYKLFGTATPTTPIIMAPTLYGEIIEEVKIYELIQLEILCNIETIVKKVSDVKKDYHNLPSLIKENMIKYNKKKGIIYVNTCKSAEHLYKLMKSDKTSILIIYIYISTDFEGAPSRDKNDSELDKFGNDTSPCVIICVGMISYGYSHWLVDLVCLGDPRQSEIDLRQIIGRGLRWDKILYPNKILHILLPVYKDDFTKSQKIIEGCKSGGKSGRKIGSGKSGGSKSQLDICGNDHLKKYLDYIIGECGQEIIYKDGHVTIAAKKLKGELIEGRQYNGDEIPTEILDAYCTTGYNKFSKFKEFLILNNVYDEPTYNELKECAHWMPTLCDIKIKYPKFCFQEIHPNASQYYSSKEEAEAAIEMAKNQLKDKIGKNKYSNLNFEQIIKKINTIDNKIPMIDVDLYYSII